MEFEAVLAQVLYLLPQEGSVSYRALKLRFQLKMNTVLPDRSHRPTPMNLDTKRQGLA